MTAAGHPDSACDTVGTCSRPERGAGDGLSRPASWYSKSVLIAHTSCDWPCLLATVSILERWAITQVVLEHGHLWGTRDVTVPVVAVGELETDLVRLTIDKHALSALPSTKP